MRTLIGTAVLVVCGLCAAGDKKDERFDAAKLIGRWKPKDPRVPV